MTWVCGGCGGALRDWHDKCWCGGDPADPSTVRGQLEPEPVDNPEQVIWQRAMAELRRRYVPPS